jgi:hypothetical protein
MKPILILLVFLFPFVVSAQQIEPGVWVKATLEDDNGNTMAAPPNVSAQFVKYQFLDDGTLKIGSEMLFSQTEAKYTILDTVLKIGFVNYKIDKLTKDTLLIHQINKNAYNTVYCYVRTASIASADKPEYNAVIQDSVYTVNRYLFPECLTPISEIMKNVDYVDGTGELQITFIVNKLGNLIDFKVTGDVKSDKGLISDFTSAFKHKSVKWLPAKLNGQNINTIVKLTYAYNNRGYDRNDRNKKMVGFRWTTIF